MWRLFLRTLLLLLSLLQYACLAEPANPDKIEDCPANTVCTLFVKDTCTVNGVKASDEALAGYLWEDESSCYASIYKSQLARLDIRPITSRNWSFVLTYFDDVGDNRRYRDDGYFDEQHLSNIGFDFGNANITFLAATMARFSWRKSDKSEWHTSLHELNFLRHFQVVDGYFHFMQYAFNIESDEPLIRYFRNERFSLLRMDANEAVALNDQRFAELLDQLSPCDAPPSVCHGDCAEMQLGGNSSAACGEGATFWFHNNAEAILTRHWKAADGLKCNLGSWEAVWRGGAQELGPQWEVQCSREMPAKWTSVLTGLCAFGSVMLVIALGVIVFCVLRCRRIARNEAKSHSDAPTFSTPSTPGIYHSPTKPSPSHRTPSPSRPSPSPQATPSPIQPSPTQRDIFGAPVVKMA